MIVSRLRELRRARGWSQDEIAERTGLSRPAVSAIEVGRVVPSVAAAIALAKVFDCRVEDIFRSDESLQPREPQWVGEVESAGSAYWRATVGDRNLRYPCEPTLAGMLPADGFCRDDREEQHPAADPERTLVVAACDPALGFLSADLQRSASVRVLPLVRSSRAALEMLGRNLVHVAGIHLQDADDPDGNQREVRSLLGPGYSLLRISRWQEGLALHPSTRVRSVNQALRAKLRWVGREEGSGARRCLDAILGRRPRPIGYEHVARHHTGVAETIRSGWAEAGVCVRLAAQSAGLGFIEVQQEDHDFCYRTDLEEDPRIQALLQVVRSRTFRRSIAELPGYDSSETGGLRRIAP